MKTLDGRLVHGYQMFCMTELQNVVFTGVHAILKVGK